MATLPYEKQFSKNYQYKKNVAPGNREKHFHTVKNALVVAGFFFNEGEIFQVNLHGQ